VRPRAGDLVLTGARRVALATTAIVAVLYLLIAIAVVLIVTHNLTVRIDQQLGGSLQALQQSRAARPGEGFNRPPGAPPFGPPVLWWTFHPDGNYDTTSVEAANIPLPVAYTSIKSPQTITISGTQVRVMGGPVGDDWAVVGQTTDNVIETRTNLVIAEALIGPVLLAVVFLGALAIGHRVGMPIERARQRQMEFAANASHELRTPLSVIQAQASLALGEPRDSTWYSQAFRRVDEESRRMRRLVDDLLWLARLDAQPGPQKADPVELGIIVQQAVDRFAAIAETRRLRLALQRAGDAYLVAAPPDWLDHLVGVLVDNACRYAPENGSVEVRLTTDGERVRLAVEDSGPGIPPEERRRIFDRFQRATSQPGGTGLGLAIADAVVRNTGGRWEIGNSALGGASVAVSWPRALASGAVSGTAADRGHLTARDPRRA
jgi:two-component system, OmpR family, sensor histidine kinase CiaH